MPPKPSNQPQSSVSSSSSSEDDNEVGSGNEGEKQVEVESVEGNKQTIPISNKQSSSAKPIVELETSMPNNPTSSSKPTDEINSKPKKTTSSAVIVAAKHRLDAENTNQHDSKKKKKLQSSVSSSTSSSSEDNEVESDTIREEQVEVESVKGKKKPISSKPIAATATVLKRSLETNNNNNKKSKKKKKKKVANVEPEKGKKLFERVFSPNDEIVVLNCLVDLKRKGISINSNNMNDLFDLVKGLLGFEANVNQLINKVQRLNQKFHNNAKRAKQPGEIPKISNPHELESFKLSNEIWGDEIGKNGALEDNQSGMALRKKKMLVSQAISPMVDLTEEENNVIGCQYQYLDQSLKPQNYLALPVPPACLGEIAAKNGWEMFGSSKARAFDQKWKSLMIKETETYLERVALVQEQTQWMLDLHKSSNS